MARIRIAKSKVVGTTKSDRQHTMRAGDLARFLLRYPDHQVRIHVTHDLDCEVVKQGPVFGAVLEGKNCISIRCGDDCR
jgi:hypothetical protein